MQMRQRHPLLAKFTGDWASIAIINSYTSSKCGRLYAKDILPVPQKYSYLKTNAAQRDQSKSRISRVKSGKQRKESESAKSSGEDEPSGLEDEEQEEDEDKEQEDEDEGEDRHEI